MTHQEILEKAIQKAIDGRWELADQPPELVSIDPSLNTTFSYWVDFVEEGFSDEARVNDLWPLQKLIFNHDFAKALWGEDIWAAYDGADHPEDAWVLYVWQYHLKEMVIADDPIAYLGEHI